FIEQQRVLLQELAKNTLEIVVAQEYQDLMEQTLRKVIKLLGSIEGQLLSLLSLFSLDSESKKNTQFAQELNQDGIDALLRKLGF
ncbi:MAG: protein phosphatase CheZ, partial [SAR324 cluster bacterium]|nr:protein phosphatase CheZ [SAR324 cluster bacterium]